jgi:hypothetical protein
LVPSARLKDAVHLVIFPNRQAADYELKVEGKEILFDPDAHASPEQSQ